MIVDDDPVSIKNLIGILRDDYELTVATSGREGYAVATPEHDMFLLDLHLPDMSGFDLLGKIKAKAELAPIPAIYITSNQDVETEETGIRLGAVDFITKPFSPAVLRARIGLHLDLRKKTQLLESLAMRDALTGVANRRRFDEIIANEWKRARRDGRLLSMIMIDIDHFKSINDRFGHQVGDETLKAVARTIDANVHRPYDTVARYGGEEFAVILYETDESGTVHVAERIRRAVEEAFTDRTSPLPRGVTISLGCASLLPTRTDGYDALIQLADARLFRAKQNGRNRVEK